MANQTIYPYGTDGQLPSSIGVINDLTTGGADKALSAEMGKLIGGREANDRARIDAIVSILKNAVFKDDESSSFAELDSLASAVDSISLNQSTIISSNGAQGATYQLIATTSPAGGIVSWSSSDASVASVDNTGLVELIGNGSCTITAFSGCKTATCSIIVSGITTLPEGFQKNKAWTNTSEATSSGSYPYYDNSLTELDGFCVTPFYPMLKSINEGGIKYSQFGIKIKGGFVSEGEQEHVCFVAGPTEISEPSENEHVQFRWQQTTNPMFKMSSANLAKSVSATFKLSELADCYIYDFVKGSRQGVAAGYLFAGSNVDTSKKPTKDNNDTYES